MAAESIAADSNLQQLDQSEVTRLLEATPQNAPTVAAPHQETEVDKNSSQFSLGQIFWWMTTVAILITLWRVASWLENSGNDRPLFMFYLGGIGTFTLLASIALAVQKTRFRLFGKVAMGVISSYRQRRDDKGQLHTYAIVHFRTAQGIYEIETTWRKSIVGQSRPVGHQVKVTYDPSFPAVAIAGEPKPESVFQIIGVGLFGVVFIVPVILYFYGFLH